MNQSESLGMVVTENIDAIMNTGICPVCLSKVLLMGMDDIALIVCPKCEWEIEISMKDIELLSKNDTK